MHERENALKEWLIDTIKHKDFTLTALAGDASFRRYFRLNAKGSTQVIMDAPPEKEDIEPFVHVAKILAKANVCTPEILAINKEQGFLLLSDFGDQLLLDKLRAETVNSYYHEAINTLFKIQQCSSNDPKLPSFDRAFMLKEMNLCPEWFFKAYLSLNLAEDECLLVQKTMEWIATEVSNQPLTFIHRDYHSRNLMLINKQEEGVLGVIDFQDAMRGPLTYDLVSLLKDCYISWPREQVLEWVAFFHSRSDLARNYSLAEFIRAFDLCGLQRHLKVLGIFSRLYLRDNKAGYLANLPLTLKYVLECSEIYEDLHPFFHFLQKRVLLP
ncbi:aminoglycoside phosphotransferase family protein [Legionella maioricensis]|uniref:Phosphotransferase n=1 Tax=Legionella maioricensis TaxID=2896528 RepID=A0A9X2ICE8_9GAMM|nr:phosphotransferase [Legionella maioricensis]MCL9685161.1 phosphotransferase [Legionella maioricensis]MCL9688326.1 phosphotransferase [Legionella maioricensis]